MRTRFQQGLDDLRQRLLRMGGLAEQAVDRARQAYVERDLMLAIWSALPTMQLTLPKT